MSSMNLLPNPRVKTTVVHQPLLNIPLDHIILDELHLMLRRCLDWTLGGGCHAVG